jgi:hypothetical protein
MTQTATAASAPDPSAQITATTGETQQPKKASKGTGPQGRVIDVSRPRRVPESLASTDALPAGKVFPIQIGCDLFRLSGASISSDGKHHPLPLPC